MICKSDLHYRTLTIIATYQQVVYLCSEFTSPTLSLHFPQLFNLYLYSKNKVFFGSVYKTHLNQQLNWNQQFLDNLQKSLSGQNKNTVVSFNHESKNLTFITEVENSKIRITLFELQLTLRKENSLQQMMRIAKTVKRKKEEKKKELKEEEEKEERMIEECKAVKAEMGEKMDFEVNFIKNSFLPIINNVKKRIRKYDEIDRQEEEEDVKTRKMYQIKPSLEKSAQKSIKSISDDFINLFK